MGYVLVALILVMGFLLHRKLVPAILCLPLFAVIIAKVALLPTAEAAYRDGGLLGYLGHFSPVLDVVIAQGAAMLVNAYIAVILGAILAAHIKETGVAEQIVRFAAEFGGDSSFSQTVTLLSKKPTAFAYPMASSTVKYLPALSFASVLIAGEGKFTLPFRAFK